jgi:hypothetical protein
MTCRVRSILIESGVKHHNHNPTPMIWIPSYLNNKSGGVNDIFIGIKRSVVIHVMSLSSYYFVAFYNIVISFLWAV